MTSTGEKSGKRFDCSNTGTTSLALKYRMATTLCLPDVLDSSCIHVWFESMCLGTSGKIGSYFWLRFFCAEYYTFSYPSMLLLAFGAGWRTKNKQTNKNCVSFLMCRFMLREQSPVFYIEPVKHQRLLAIGLLHIEHLRCDIRQRESCSFCGRNGIGQRNC